MFPNKNLLLYYCSHSRTVLQLSFQYTSTRHPSSQTGWCPYRISWKQICSL